MNGFQSLGEAVASGLGVVVSDDGTRVVLWLLALVFLWSGTAKMRNPTRAAWALVDFGVARHVRPSSGIAFATVEVASGVALGVGAVLGGAIAVAAATVAAVLFAAFVVAIARSLSRGETFECFCFGEASGSLSIRTLVRAGALAALAAVAASHAGDVAMAPAAEAALLPAVVAASALSVGVLLSLVPNLVTWNAHPFEIDERHYVQRIQR